MQRSQSGDLTYYQFDALSQAGLTHGIFTRLGGVSPAPWDSLNVGGMVGDEPGHTIENTKRIFEAVGLQPESSYDCWLVHSTDAIRVEGPRPVEAPYQKADILLTDRSEVTLFMRFADCVPIFLYDPVHRVIGLAHAGWIGTLNRVAGVAVRRMQAWYQSKPEKIYACIGPSIGVDHYPVGFDVVNKAKLTFGADASRVLDKRDDHIHLDLWEANRLILHEAGVEQIEIAGICTACHHEEWFSHRADRGKTGRFGGLITLGHPNG